VATTPDPVAAQNIVDIQGIEETEGDPDYTEIETTDDDGDVQVDAFLPTEVELIDGPGYVEPDPDVEPYPPSLPADDLSAPLDESME